MITHNPSVRWRPTLPGLCLVIAVTASGARGLLVSALLPQSLQEISPDAVAEISEVTPSQVSGGSGVRLVITGRNFARGVYVSFSHPEVRVLATTRISSERVEACVAVGSKVPAGALHIYVSNSAGPVAESQLVVLRGAESAELPQATSAAAELRSGFVPAETSPATAPAQAAHEQAAGKAERPEVTSVDPQHASPGAEVALKIKGKNFASGATVAFSNPGIRVSETRVRSDKEITVSMKLSEDAPSGPTGLFVVNPDDSETEFPFTVSKEVSEPAASRQATPAASQPAADHALSFEVLNLGEGINIFQSANKPKGTLSVAGGKIKYEEAGKEIFSAAPAEIADLSMNVILGVNTGTFHLALKSDKTFNFVPASLRPAETSSIVEALRNALK